MKNHLTKGSFISLFSEFIHTQIISEKFQSFLLLLLVIPVSFSGLHFFHFNFVRFVNILAVIIMALAAFIYGFFYQIVKSTISAYLILSIVHPGEGEGLTDDGIFVAFRINFYLAEIKMHLIVTSNQLFGTFHQIYKETKHHCTFVSESPDTFDSLMSPITGLVYIK